MQIDLYWYSGSLQENVDAAYAAIVYALAIEPENPEIVWRLAWIQRETDSLEKAIQNLRRADELGAKGLRYANEAGFLWSNNGQQYPDGYERAVPLLNTWLTYNSWDITASFWLCSALIHLERFDDALQVANAFAPQATDAAEFGNLAYIAYRAGDYEQARQWADTARALSAEAYNATYVLGLLSWYADGNLEQSMSYLDSLQEVDFWDYFVNPEFGHFLNVDRARIFNAAGDSQSALAAYQQALDESGDWLVIYPEMADIQIALGDTEAARQSLIYSLDAVRYSEPYNHDRGNELRQRLVNLVWGEAALDVTHPLTDLQALRGEIPLAVLSGADPRLDEIDQMLLAGQGDAALARINQALEADPDNAQALALRVIVQLAVGGETDAMLADADRAIELAPDQVLGYIAKADTLALNSDDDAGAMATLQTALQIAPDHPELLWRIANVSWATATTEEAADYLNRAEAAGAQGYRYSDFAGYFWYEQGDYARALPLLKTACIVRPYVWICQHYLGALIQTGQTDEALRIAREMTTLLDRQEPDDYDLIAYAAYRAGDYEQARAWAQLAYAYRPEDTSISYLLGLISGFGENDPATAMQYLDVVQPDSYNFFVNGRYGHDLGMDRARIYAHVGDTENARTAYEAALANGGPAEWYIERADFYIALGDTEAARADLQYALEGTDDPDQRQAILDKITALGPAQ
jgi:tetratricopeptide (TPR) repeat protein